MTATSDTSLSTPHQPLHGRRWGWLDTLRRDIQSVFDRDPAARSTLEVLLTYPGLHALWGYRLAHWLWLHRLKLAGRWVSHLFRSLTGIEIHPAASIGPGLFIDHAPDLNHTALPDPFGVSLTSLLQRVQSLEERLDGHETVAPHIHAPDHGTWHGADFSI